MKKIVFLFSFVLTIKLVSSQVELNDFEIWVRVEKNAMDSLIKKSGAIFISSYYKENSEIVNYAGLGLIYSFIYDLKGIPKQVTMSSYFEPRYDEMLKWCEQNMINMSENQCDLCFIIDDIGVQFKTEKGKNDQMIYQIDVVRFFDQK